MDKTLLLLENLPRIFTKMNLPGKLRILKKTNNKFEIHVNGFKPFLGFYSEDFKNTFTLQILNEKANNSSNLTVDHIEAITFKADTMEPEKFLIYQYPKTQIVYLKDTEEYKKGNIVVYSASPFRGGKGKRLVNHLVLTPKASAEIANLFA